MTELKKYNLEGKETGSVEANAKITESSIHSQLIKEYIVAIRKNARQWSANTKGRSEVKHTTKKPHRQKGTGRARQGSLVAPQFRGGGVVFGPKPKFDQHVRINKKEKRSAIRFLLGEMMRENRMIVLENAMMDKPKTKTLAAFIKKANLGKRVLFLAEGKHEEIQTAHKTVAVSVKCNDHENFRKSLNNIPKTQFALAKNVNGYDLMLADNIVVTEAALEEINHWLA
ncbi:50S ribosomal protein L4 [Waddlia chondrophila 2032/99]|uniref:Large ribosomal subunit protein uL4 n=2 Tax=Waddlia chondrophila TaxID=71667 RepID=D6YS05_WADCW|nr:50S ribosomal protein L4 [Waddlia chondrophila]ADI38850.1 50S ribosomal protein L4 [Waddlia chondrophila WSU 86-1044]CCB90376.1 50S ribosomal protein L4 [Waddlia chondrophila 2032/99]